MVQITTVRCQLTDVSCYLSTAGSNYVFALVLALLFTISMRFITYFAQSLAKYTSSLGMEAYY